jgi:hypothetical protein
MSKSIKVYACSIAFEHEMGVIPVTVYPTIEALKEAHKCTDECGICELTVSFKSQKIQSEV